MEAAGWLNCRLSARALFYLGASIFNCASGEATTHVESIILMMNCGQKTKISAITIK
jgi:hypothetical protein